MTIKVDGRSDIVINTRAGEGVRLPSDVEGLFLHGQACLRRCLEIERDAGGVFPYVVREKGGGSVGSRSCLSIPASINTPPVATPSKLQTVFLEGVGWCVKVGDVYTCLFLDGAKIAVESGREVVEWEGRVWRIGDGGIGSEGRRRLAGFGRFLEMF